MKKDFESRFIPNVKFCTIGHEDDFIKYVLGNIPSECFKWYGTDSNGNLFCSSNDKHYFDKYEPIIFFKEVSIYEAIPELIPNGMVHDKESDSLLSVDIVRNATQCGKTYLPDDWAKENIYQADRVNNGCKNPNSKHYELWGDFESIDAIKKILSYDEYLGFLKGNILKYQLRLGKKDDVSKEKEKIKDYQRELNNILGEKNDN